MSTETDKIKRNILNLYREDIRKHADELNLKVEQIYKRSILLFPLLTNSKTGGISEHI